MAYDAALSDGDDGPAISEVVIVINMVIGNEQKLGTVMNDERRLSMSYWKPVDEDAVCDLTIGDLLRRAAESAPSTSALVE
ncbi:hypothetical protein, partial [Streptomyces sp. NPDC001833]|uniref:hypothetical protein n=1 Tax=Streptomyces sp. NPDC001833 TaxID=3154658 RepID=UPI00332D6FF5